MRAILNVDWNLKRWPEMGLTKLRKQRRTVNRAIVDMNGHELVSRGVGAWECEACRLWARGDQGRRALLRRPCKGDLLTQTHATHRTRHDNGVLWCERCGAFAARLLRGLRRRCPGAPSSEAQRNVLRRLRQGLRPTTAAYLTTDAAAARRAPRRADTAAADARLQLRPDNRLPSISRSTAAVRRRQEHPAIGPTANSFYGVYLRLSGGPLQKNGPANQTYGASQLPAQLHGDERAAATAADRSLETASAGGAPAEHRGSSSGGMVISDNRDGENGTQCGSRTPAPPRTACRPTKDGRGASRSTSREWFPLQLHATCVGTLAEACAEDVTSASAHSAQCSGVHARCPFKMVAPYRVRAVIGATSSTRILMAVSPHVLSPRRTMRARRTHIIITITMSAFLLTRSHLPV